VLGLVLGGRNVVECFVESLIVIEADEVEDLVLGLLERAEAAPVDVDSSSLSVLARALWAVDRESAWASAACASL